MNVEEIKAFFEENTKGLFPREGDYASLSPDQICQLILKANVKGYFRAMKDVQNDH